MTKKTEKAERVAKAKKSVTSISMTTGQAAVALAAVKELSSNSMGVVMSVRVRRILTAFKEYGEELETRSREVFDRHSGGAEEIKRGTDAHKAFVEEIEAMRAEVCEIEISPINLEELGDNVMLSPASLDVLLERGIIIED